MDYFYFYFGVKVFMILNLRVKLCSWFHEELAVTSAISNIHGHILSINAVSSI